MSEWLSDALEAAEALGMEASVIGQGLPGSMLSVKLGNVFLNFVEDAEIDEEDIGPYKDMYIGIRESYNGERQVMALQNPVDGFIHPHIGIPYFCFGGNGRNLELWARNGDWGVLLNNIRSLTQQYWPSGAYGDAGRFLEGCRCVARIEYGDTPAALSHTVCHECSSRRCSFCGERKPLDQMWKIGTSEDRLYNACTECLLETDISFCPSCGRISSNVSECPATGNIICGNCGIKCADGVYYHRSAVHAIQSRDIHYMPASEGHRCPRCDHFVPNAGSVYGEYFWCSSHQCHEALSVAIMEDSNDNFQEPVYDLGRIKDRAEEIVAQHAERHSSQDE